MRALSSFVLFGLVACDPPAAVPEHDHSCPPGHVDAPADPPAQPRPRGLVAHEWGSPTEVRLSVVFERGGLTEWFPYAREVDWGHIDWGRFWVEPATASALARLPEADARAHYFAAHDSDADVVRVLTPGSRSSCSTAVSVSSTCRSWSASTARA